MVSIERPNSAKSLVDSATGVIDREVFVSDELYRLELERVFTRTWLFVGHESQIPNPNDYFVSRMGEESVILTRDRQGEIHVLLNTCRHRGMKVCRYDEGNTPVFSCPYHGWSYSTDGNLVSVPGELIGVPQFATAYHGELEKEEWGLISVPKMANYKGTIWACWDENAPEFVDYLGGMKVFFDQILQTSDGNDQGLAFAGVQKWMMPCNWKFAAENFIGDFYHGISHGSAPHRRLGGRRPATPGTGGTTVFYAFPEGHGTRGYAPEYWQDELGDDQNTAKATRLRSAQYIDTDSERLGQYIESSEETRATHASGRGTGTSVSTIFPNMSTLDSMESGGGLTIAVWHPVGPRMTEAWRWFFVDKNAPPDVRDFLRHHRLTWSGPSGMVEEDDMENWNYASEASTGTVAKRYPYHYGQGLKHETTNEAVPGAVLSDTVSSEQNQRHMYKRWAEFMDAESWNDLK